MAESAPIEYSLQSAAFPSTPLVVSRLLIDEGMSRPYFATVDVSMHDPDADATLFGGDDAVVSIKRAGVERRLCGIVVRVEETKFDKALPQVQLRVAPALELGRFRRNTRMFQEKTVPQILQTVLDEILGPYGREAQLDLDEANYEPREYCLQYQESDLDFVTRLMEEEGIAYSFDHAADVELLRLTDANQSFEPVLTMAGDGVGHFEGTNLALTTDREPIHRFRLAHESTTTKIVVGDFDWSQSAMPIEETADGDQGGQVRESYEHGLGRSLQIGSFDAGAKAYQKNDAARQAPLRQEAAVGSARVGHGMGRLIGMQPGVKLTLEDHPDGDLNTEYLVTRVTHTSAAAPLEGTGGGAGEPYHNTFECVPIEVPHRPRRTTRKPRIDGVETAVVTGTSGEEIEVDAHGRIKVQFHWDRENPANETSSCWIRVKQEWAGAGWGFWWVPRIGMEVVVHFVDGDPDRPLVTGAVYNSTNTLPYPLPDEKTKSTIKSNSSLGGGGFNEFRFEDKAGSEEIYTHAQKDYNEVVENDHNTLVHHDQTNTVDNNQTQTVDVDQTERVDAEQTMTVGGNRTVHVKGNYDETVDGTETRKVAGAVSETFAANETRTVSGSVTETLAANETRDVGANLDETIGGAHTLNVTGSETLTVTGAQTRDVTGGITTTTPAAQSVTVTGSWSVTAAAGLNILAPGGATLLIPGGVARADDVWDRMIGDEKCIGGITCEIVATKLDVAAFVTAVWGVKLDFCGFQKGNEPAELSLWKLKLRQAAAMAKRSQGALTEAEALRLLL